MIEAIVSDLDVQGQLINLPFTIEWLPIDKILSDRQTAVGHQRPLNKAKAFQIARKMRVNAIEPPFISRRADGVLWPMGGQHRLYALSMRACELAPCRVFDGLSLEEEKAIWVALNTATAGKGLPLYHGQVGTDPDVSEIDRIVRLCGYQVPQSYGKNARNAISAVSALRWIYQQGSSSGLSEVLLTLSKAWPNDPKATGEGILRGLFIFLRAHGDRVNREKLQLVLSRTSVDALLRQASKHATNYRSRNYMPVAYAFTDVYNEHVRRLTDKLEPVAVAQYSTITGPAKSAAKKAGKAR